MMMTRAALPLCLALLCLCPTATRADEVPVEDTAETAPAPPPAAETEPAETEPSEPIPRPRPRPRPVAPPAVVTFVPEPRPPRGEDRFELTLNLEANGLSSRRMGRISDSDAALGVALRFGWKLNGRLTLYAGWRMVTGIEAHTSSYQAATTAHAALLGARWSEPLTSWLDLVAEADLELMHASTTLTLSGNTGRDGGLGVGFGPRIGLGAHSPFLDALTLHVRLMVGYAFRSAHRLDALTFDGADAGATVSTDVGSTNLSGPVIALSAGLAF